MATTNNSSNDNPAKGGLYSQSAKSSNIRRTYIAGMKPREDKKTSGQEEMSDDGRYTRINLQERPLAGILYSVSRDTAGEIFPIYVGRNTIGSEPECDVYLPEDTVSSNHAVLLVRMLPNDEGGRTMTVSITDYDSEFGTAVNGTAVEYDPARLSGMERIMIGNAYNFIFIPLDQNALGLIPDSSFRAMPRKDFRGNAVTNANAFYAPASDEDIYPSAVGEEDEHTFYGRSFRKKEDHSGNKTI